MSARPRPASNGMKILIGTPIHQIKDYAMEKWLKNVSRLRLKYPCDFLIVDNSLNTAYIEKVKKYCEKYKITNYKIKHIKLPPDRERYERMARAREVIRQEFLSKDYDAWFSWESDIIIPTDTLGKLVKLMKAGDFSVVDHNCWMRGFPSAYCTDFGIALVARKALGKYSFILEFGTDPEMPKTYEPSEAWFKARVLGGGGKCIEVDNLIRPITHLNPLVSKKMNILIAAPIHESKDYSMDRWLENVSRQEHPADLLMVDNSPDTGYIEKVEAYCAKHGLTNYKIIHLELPVEQKKHERVARSREVIRQYFLDHDYDAWFVWECDQIIPVNTLDNLIKIMKQENYLMVNPNKWAREDSTTPNTDFGVCLIKREALEKHNFILEFNNPETPDTWETGERWFKSQVLKNGGNYIDVYGVIDPIYHLNQ
ncbi:MAG: hypothetical protein HW400_72 [Candidatus Levybacteria bacterium]|nr:hypothetical protein [Candidatus Levybacteria bacterium]